MNRLTSIVAVFVAMSACCLAETNTAPSDTPAATPAPAAESAGAPTAAPKPADDDSAMFGFTPGKTTFSEVKAKFGKPTLENHMFPDAFSAVFNPRPDLMIACLFDKNGVLIRLRAYVKN